MLLTGKPGSTFPDALGFFVLLTRKRSSTFPGAFGLFVLLAGEKGFPSLAPWEQAFSRSTFTLKDGLPGESLRNVREWAGRQRHTEKSKIENRGPNGGGTGAPLL